MKTKVRYVYTVTSPEIEVTSKQLDRQTKFIVVLVNENFDNILVNTNKFFLHCNILG